MSNRKFLNTNEPFLTSKAFLNRVNISIDIKNKMKA